MIIHFHIHYRTVFGEQMGIEYTIENEKTQKTLQFQTYDGENWTALLNVGEKKNIFYNYIVLKNGVSSVKEWGKPRSIFSGSLKTILAEDTWRARKNEDNAFFSTAFTESIFKRKPQEDKVISAGKKKATHNKITFRLHSASIPPHLSYGISGNADALGNWTSFVQMDEKNFPDWETTLDIADQNIYLEYKFVIVNNATGEIVSWEDGDNRRCNFVIPDTSLNQLIITDDNFRYSGTKWMGSGVAIPVFSLRSKKGMGIGEFSDLNGLIDWAKETGLTVIQTLPINDTIANKTWQDSYPYAAISVFALHPLYINIQKTGTLAKKEDIRALDQVISELNKTEFIDFEKVMEQKFFFLRKLFEQDHEKFRNDRAAVRFIEENSEWLKPYAVFCHLRDKYKTCNFNIWPANSTFGEEIISSFCNESYDSFKEIEFYYFLQYHADLQLMEAKTYARSNGIVLKGDLPIGIYRYSCDAWVAPQLYNMDEQAGAPPDDYAVLGQNWGFPTYNWNEMAKDGFKWWRKRMHQLNRYFDALRIDHILGFFRIWQIPTDQVEGTMGMFNPRLPFSRDELARYGIWGDLSRYSAPFIHQQNLESVFATDYDDIFDMFFSRQADGKIVMKSSFDTQKKISDFISQNEKYKKYEKNLLELVSEVLLISEPNSDGNYFNPRITLTSTNSYNALDHYLKSKFNDLYNDYYFTRHDQFWKEQALRKLPAILDASDMLICGEDLGMIPKAVPGVMRDLNIMSLEIQRMPKGNSKFGQVASYPYYSVCSPSCHDMSTIRGWWQADHENAKDYYYNYLKWYGLTPMECNTDIVQAIVEDHLASPSMLAIFPIQDIIGMDAKLRKADAFSEQINEPSNPKHYWRYRFHMNIEDLKKEKDVNFKIRSLILKHRR